MRDKPTSVTELPLSPELERRSRMIKYTIAMSIRVVCIGLCLVVSGWWLLIPAAGAIFLPYVAVVIANNVSSRPARVRRPVGCVARSGASGRNRRPRLDIRIRPITPAF